MSKSKGTFIRASTYLEHLDPSYLRYYYASKLSSGVDDIDLSFEDFTAKVNSDLVGKVVNIASRTARFVAETGLSAEYPGRRRIVRVGRPRRRRNRRRLRNLRLQPGHAVDHGRRRPGQQFIEASKPWELAKTRDSDPKAAAGCKTRVPSD